MANKYPISKEFFPLTLFTAPMNPQIIGASQKAMGVPKFIERDADIAAETHLLPSYQNGEVEVLLLKPRAAQESLPCLINIHGGGFVFEAAHYQYRLALEYAKQAHCVVAFVRYRLAPAYPFPVPQEDCYCAAQWVFEHAADLGIDVQRIGIGGDSAGGTLTATTCLMLRDRGQTVQPLFQLLIYPWLDGRNDSESNRKYTDVPVWNSTLSQKVGPLINPDPAATPLAYQSPAQADSLANLPPAYIEVAQFDCLHDDGLLYAELLRAEGIEVEYHETEGTIHGFDAVLSAPTTKDMLAKRVAFMRRMFWD